MGGQKCPVELISSELIEVIGKPVAMVTLCDDKGQLLLGSAFVKDSQDNAVAGAVLDALNRRIASYLLNKAFPS